MAKNSRDIQKRAEQRLEHMKQMQQHEEQAMTNRTQALAREEAAPLQIPAYLEQKEVKKNNRKEWWKSNRDSVILIVQFVLLLLSSIAAIVTICNHMELAASILYTLSLLLVLVFCVAPRYFLDSFWDTCGVRSLLFGPFLVILTVVFTYHYQHFLSSVAILPFLNL